MPEEQSHRPCQETYVTQRCHFHPRQHRLHKLFAGESSRQTNHGCLAWVNGHSICCGFLPAGSFAHKASIPWLRSRARRGQVQVAERDSGRLADLTASSGEQIQKFLTDFATVRKSSTVCPSNYRRYTTPAPKHTAQKFLTASRSKATCYGR